MHSVYLQLLELLQHRHKQKKDQDKKDHCIMVLQQIYCHDLDIYCHDVDTGQYKNIIIII